MRYAIYHPSLGNYYVPHRSTLTPYYVFKHIYSVDAESLEDAFKQAQNDFNPEYESLGVRSTCVGDIIQSESDFEWGVCQMVANTGFLQLPDTGYLFSFHDPVTFAQELEDLKNECDLNSLENQSPE